MNGYLPLSFVEEKVRDLENALFFSTSDAVLKMPTRVVRVLRIDKLGHLWFVVPRPTQFIHAFEKEFPAKMDFFRKGKDYYLKVLGNAFIVSDPEDINWVEELSDNIKQSARKNELVILKVKITHVDYAEKHRPKTTVKMLMSQVSGLFFQWFQLEKGTSPGFFRRIPATHSVHSPVYSN
ncbi:MAG: pyridoxamine 5'-phosphate oxidase family protein [Puia sp.]